MRFYGSVKNLHVCGYSLLAFLIAACLAGCSCESKHDYASVPKSLNEAVSGGKFMLTSVAWESLSLRYCVGEGPVVASRTWSTSDKVILNKLRGMVNVQRVRESWMNASMTTNELTVVLVGGEQVRITVLDHGLLAMHRLSDPKDSVSVRVTSTFVDGLTAIVTEQTGDLPRLYYNQEVMVK